MTELRGSNKLQKCKWGKQSWMERMNNIQQQEGSPIRREVGGMQLERKQKEEGGGREEDSAGIRKLGMGMKNRCSLELEVGNRQ